MHSVTAAQSELNEARVTKTRTRPTCVDNDILFVDNRQHVSTVTRDRSTKAINTSRDNGMCGGQRTETLRKNMRVDTQRDDNEWRVVSRRRSTQDRRTPGQTCAKCGESNHVTARYKHAGHVQCRQCGQLGHKEKHHAWD